VTTKSSLPADFSYCLAGFFCNSLTEIVPMIYRISLQYRTDKHHNTTTPIAQTLVVTLIRLVKIEESLDVGAMREAPVSLHLFQFCALVIAPAALG
jgi:hypothetical protein